MSELQPKYAPELKIAGTALGGLLPNITTLTRMTDGADVLNELLTVIRLLQQELPCRFHSSIAPWPCARLQEHV
jgi:hypothetical protein